MSRHKTKTGPSRQIRIADQIQKDLAFLIQRELGTRHGLITLTRVDLSADYAHAKVYFSVLGAEAMNAQEVLNEKAGYLHSLLYKMLHIHTVPTLRFFHDDQLSHVIEMSKLIDKANNVESCEISADDEVEFAPPKIRGL
ncbi:30S ribosome-binding factor RbfA [Taylorella equigenitalis]|uniref:Ribosome-binding factor A n=3 Tax=Taylorella equigenitalis TaxID=29575 RepID=A0A654KF35_TAYEM|nr:30S ribosome-binding factor RbfA [Taylorella equigenitalis]ADU90995.1 Ribosome-binding factor A [Taylorella equigenitalis MCE9]AFN36101.1 ribosome-binding factor A [Taylorella equigenitalis ATCC 35865]ASY30737.1 ribosome-binding factor A [Taylorella equigenitalis]ASY38036.1 30S ribosome-binding factor RbfA [Taylorella equigenitalis]ASY39514.1 ribosome-binding factor A [Taylorella equigenitalis]